MNSKPRSSLVKPIPRTPKKLPVKREIEHVVIPIDWNQQVWVDINSPPPDAN